MSLIVEFELSTPILRQTAETSSPIHVEEVSQSETGDTKLTLWVYGDNLAGFEAVLESDESVDEFTLLEEQAGKRLYSVTLTEWGASQLTSPAAAAHDISFLDITVTGETRIRARVPSRDALFAYRDSCRERDVPFRLRRIYEEEESDTEQYGLSGRQREALLTALEEGYFSVPRETTLSAIAEKLEISDQALSARLRRGQANLLRTTLAETDPS